MARSRGAAYAEYVRRTSGFIPWPPRLEDGAVESGQPGQGVEAAVGAGPVRADGLDPGPPYDAAQDERDDDRVVGIADDRQEVGDKVDRHGQVDHQQREAH